MGEPDDTDRALLSELRAELAAARQERAEAAAEREAARVEREEARVDRERHGAVAAGVKVSKVFARFKAAYEGRTCWRHARPRLEAFVAVFGDDDVASVTPPRWAAFRDEQKATGLCALTVNFTLDWAKRMFNWAMEPEQGMLKANPLQLAKREKTRDKRETWITEEDVQLALRSPLPKNKRARRLLRALVLIWVDTGLRFNEGRKLRRDRCRQRPDGIVVADVGRTKNGKPHFVALTGRAWTALGDVDPVLGSVQYFANSVTKNLYCERQIRRWFREMCEGAGLDSRVADGDVQLRPHDLRHTAGTAADRRGASLRAIQRMLNHSSLAITERYVHRDEEGAVALARLMEDGARDEREAAHRQRLGPHRAPEGVSDDHTNNSKSTAT